MSYFRRTASPIGKKDFRLEFSREPAAWNLLSISDQSRTFQCSRPEYKNIVPYAPGIMVINRANIPLDVPCQINLAPAQIDAIDTSQDRLWVFGFIRFKDFLGEPHDVRFCLKWAVHPQRGERHAFVWDDGTPPEYTKRT
jgi:hypothetical protein